jgi:hypothetical protein
MACALSYTHTHVQSPIAMRYHASDSTAQHFRQHTHAYNSSLCMASTGLHTPQHQQPYTMFVQGRVYHSIGPLLQLCWWCCVSPGWPHFVGVCPLLHGEFVRWPCVQPAEFHP